jgi:long-chain acyl-CoA synthetase
VGKINGFAQLDPAREALVDEQYSISFGELPPLINKYEQRLRELGISPNCTVGLSISEQIPHVLVCLALLKLRAHQVTLDTRESPQYITTICDRLDVSRVIRLADGFDSASAGLRDFDVTIREGATAEPVLQHDRDPLIFAMTSGTTQGPRIVPYTEHILAQQAMRYDGFNFDRVLALPSIQHDTPKRLRLMSLFRGATSLFYRGNTSTWRDIAQFVADKSVDFLRITILNAVTLSKQPGHRLALTTSIDIGSTHISIGLRKLIQKNLSEHLYVHYGSTESGRIAMTTPDEHDERESVGRPLKGVTVEIIDGNGVPIPAGQIGEIRVRGEGMVSGYHDDPKESARRFRDGWYYPGDLGSMTADGKLIVRGRKDDMMILNGFNIYPAEIERAFERHPEVVAAAAFPIRSRSHGEIPAVAIELAKGSKMTEQALMRYSRDRLGIRCPRKVFIVDRMPRNALGKILTRTIAAMVNGDFVIS